MSPNDLKPCYVNAKRPRSRKRSGRRDEARKRQRDPRGRFLAKGDQLPIQRTTNAESTGRVGKEEKGQACNGQTNGSTTDAENIPMAMKSSFCMEEGLEALQRIDNCIKEDLPAGLDYDCRNQEAFRLLKNLKQRTQDVLERRPGPQSHSGLIFSRLCDVLQISEDLLLHLLTSLR
jgi:hypothetical protein